MISCFFAISYSEQKLKICCDQDLNLVFIATMQRTNHYTITAHNEYSLSTILKKHMMYMLWLNHTIGYDLSWRQTQG